MSTDLQPALIGRPTYTAAGADTVPPEFTVVPTGAVGADGLPPDTLDPQFGADPTVGKVQSYRHLTQTKGGGFGASLPAPLGGFTTADLAMPFNQTSYVPLGAFDANVTTAVDSPAQAGSDSARGTPVLPSLSGLDFITAPPGAFTDLAGGAALRGGTTPIDAIRVRVAGITGYTPEAVAKVDKIAKAIAALGVTATVVAGSSPQPVAVYVPDYHLDKTGVAADLGWVRQDWTTLGAAQTVVTARASLVDWLVDLGVGVAAIAAICAAVLSGRLRRTEVGVLRTVGWTEFRIRRRLSAAQVVPLVLVLAAAVITIVLARDRSLATLASAGGVLAALIAAVSAVLVAAAHTTGAPGRRRVGAPVVSPGGLLWRQTRATPWTALAKVLGPTVTGIGAAAVLTAVLTARHASGNTRLAAAVDSATLTGTVILAVVGTLAAVLVTAIGARTDRRHRGQQWNTLRDIGFRESALRRIHLVEVGWTAAAVIVLAAAATIAATAADLTPVAAIPVGIPAAAAAVLTAGIFSVRTPR